jgi:hypothetical protein
MKKMLALAVGLALAVPAFAGNERARVVIGPDVTGLPQKEKLFIKYLVQAADAVDELYYAMKEGAEAVVPEDVSPEELSAWLEQQTPEARDAFVMGRYQAVRRDGSGGFVLVPYAEAYEIRMMRVAELARTAAMYSDEAKVRRYLRVTADALESNNFVEAHLRWMELTDTRYDMSLSFNEFFTAMEDRYGLTRMAPTLWFGIRDPSGTQLITDLQDRLQRLDATLPVDDGVPRWELPATPGPWGFFNAIYVTPQDPLWWGWIYSDDPELQEAAGGLWKTSMASNIAMAEIEVLAGPIARAVLAPELAARFDADVAFKMNNLHELGHQMGPQSAVLPGGDEVPVGDVFGHRTLNIEEAKAEMISLVVAQKLLDEGYFPADMRMPIYAAMAVRLIQSARVDIDDDHTLGAIIAYNRLIAEGGMARDAATGLHTVDPDRFHLVIKDLTRIYLSQQRTGDLAGYEALIAQWGTPGPELQATLAHLDSVQIPAEIYAEFTVKDQLGM